MDDTVVNKTVPLILCDEEDVSGAHGGSIGRLDDETLFYMMSRGMSKEAVYETVAASRIDAVINMIPVPTVKERWIKRLHLEEE
jgi:Fe-S cluster assembly scaffold protein SufB